MSFFSSVTAVEEDPIFGLSAIFRADPRKDKVNLGVGTYKDEKGETIVLASVRKAEQIIISQNLNKTYPAMQGETPYIEEALKIVYGNDLNREVFGAQTLGGTGALRIGAEFLKHNKVSNTIYLSDPTWPNHRQIFRRVGMEQGIYPYYNSSTKSLDMEALYLFLESIPENSTILLQPCCHNPTGLTPEFSDWQTLCSLIKEKNLIPFFDMAYQGFDIDIEEDANVVRYFAKQGVEMLVASSFSKNFGLYGERVGLLSIITNEKEVKERVGSQIKRVIRGSYSVPPLHGERIVTTILQSETLKKEWKEELASMRNRVIKMRKLFAAALLQNGESEEVIRLLEKQTGMFSYSGLTKDSVEKLQKEWGIYMPPNGRINIAGLNEQNLDYVVNAIISLRKS